jgi:hypothetical protein
MKEAPEQHMGHPKKSATQHRKKIPLNKLGLFDIFSSWV